LAALAAATAAAAAHSKVPVEKSAEKH